MKIRGSLFLQSESSFSIATIKSTMVDENVRELSGFCAPVKLAQVTSLEGPQPHLWRNNRRVRDLTGAFQEPVATPKALAEINLPLVRVE